MCSRCHIRVELRGTHGVINPAKSEIKKVIEAFMNILSLVQDHCVPLDSRLTNSRNGIDLMERNIQ